MTAAAPARDRLLDLLCQAAAPMRRAETCRA